MRLPHCSSAPKKQPFVAQAPQQDAAAPAFGAFGAADFGAAQNPGVVYEVRIYSLEAGAEFGSVVRARPVRAAHCLTSIQFSPTSQHLLLAYGR